MGITVAIVPDGNRRWAKKQGKPVMEGHRVGINKLKDLAEWCKDLDVDNLIVWIFSTENASRNKEEVKGLFELFDKTLDRLDKEEIKGARIRFVGKRDIFPKRIIDKADRLEEKTRKEKRSLIILVGYGGRQEIVDAVNRLIKDAKDGKVSMVDEKIFSSYMYAPDMPDPDIVIRTGEKRLSGLLPWQSVYSELYFIDKLWPEFTKEDLVGAISDYRQRERRFGK